VLPEDSVLVYGDPPNGPARAREVQVGDEGRARGRELIAEVPHHLVEVGLQRVVGQRDVDVLLGGVRFDNDAELDQAAESLLTD
jgi:hypothetical protein